MKIYQTIITNNIVIVNTNQIILNTYPDFLKENYLNLKGYYWSWYFWNLAYKIHLLEDFLTQKQQPTF